MLHSTWFYSDFSVFQYLFLLNRLSAAFVLAKTCSNCSCYIARLCCENFMLLSIFIRSIRSLTDENFPQNHFEIACESRLKLKVRSSLGEFERTHLGVRDPLHIFHQYSCTSPGRTSFVSPGKRNFMLSCVNGRTPNRFSATILKQWIDDVCLNLKREQ